MGNLLKAELFKLRKSFHYKLLLLFPFGIGLIFGGLIYYYDSQTVGMRMFSVWGTGTLYNAALISIFAAEYIGSEFANRTFAASISCGAPRRRLFAVKCIIFFLALLPLIYIQDLTTFLILSYKNGLGIAWNMETAAYIANKIFCSSLCNLTMGSFILLLAFCVKCKIVTIGLGLCSVYLLNLLHINARSQMLQKVLRFTFPYQLEEIGRDSSEFMRIRYFHEPVTTEQILISSLIAIVILTLTALWVFQKSDLK